MIWRDFQWLRWTERIRHDGDRCDRGHDSRVRDDHDHDAVMFCEQQT